MLPVSIPSNVIGCNMDVTQYQNELVNRITSASKRTRAAVVKAANYLAAEFPYKIPYRPEGRQRGFIANKDGSYKSNWGCPIKDKDYKTGLDPAGFITWAYLTAGFNDIEKEEEYRWNSDNFETISFGVEKCDYIKANIKSGDVLQRGGSHFAIVLQTSEDKIKIAQISPKGLNVEFVSICTGEAVDGSLNSFTNLISMEKYFKKFGNN
jgi:hypothetical protein